MIDKQTFLNPRSHYRGEFKPESLVFNANLQEFSQRVGFICGLETSGKISPSEAFQEMRSLWKQLKQSYLQLDGNHPTDHPDANDTTFS